MVPSICGSINFVCCLKYICVFDQLFKISNKLFVYRPAMFDVQQLCVSTLCVENPLQEWLKMPTAILYADG
jgi:hypothetical protein